MAIYRDEISRITLPQIRAQFNPQDFAKRESVTLTRGTLTVSVKIVRETVRGGLKAPRVFLECGTCGNTRANVLAFGYGEIGCRRCMAWRSREAQTAKRMAPHTGSVSVSAPRST